MQEMSARYELLIVFRRRRRIIGTLQIFSHVIDPGSEWNFKR